MITCFFLSRIVLHYGDLSVLTSPGSRWSKVLKQDFSQSTKSNSSIYNVKLVLFRLENGNKKSLFRGLKIDPNIYRIYSVKKVLRKRQSHVVIVSSRSLYIYFRYHIEGPSFSVQEKGKKRGGSPRRC